MKFPQPYTLEQIATIINCPFVGDKAFPVLGMNEIHVVEQGDIVFVDHPKYYDKALQSKATIVLINKEVLVQRAKRCLFPMILLGISISSLSFSNLLKRPIHWLLLRLR